MPRPFSPRKVRRARGFSLVLSLTIMAMLLLLCISIAALMAIELRVGRAAISRAKAKLNALAGARIALGQLQQLAGPDRAITANAAILGVDAAKLAAITRPRALGVWRSGVLSANYDTGHESAFKGWLMSGLEAPGGRSLASVAAPANAGSAVKWISSNDAAKAKDEWLLYDGGTAAYQGATKLLEDFDKSPGVREPLRLYARPEVMGTDASGNPDASQGAFAWVVMDENQKARVDLREYADSLTDADRAIVSSGAAARFHPGYAADGASLANWISSSTEADTSLPGWLSLGFKQDTQDTKSAWFPLESDNHTLHRALRHDFTLGSVSLLTDTLNGGLKRDLNTLALLSDGDFKTEAQKFGNAPPRPRRPG